MIFASNRETPFSRLLKPSLFLAGGLALFLNGCLSGVTDETGAKESSNTLAVGMATPATQPADLIDWIDEDIGAVGLAGSSTLSGTTLTVLGSGADIWGRADGFHFKHRRFYPGGGMLTARVTGLQATDPWAKAGIMVRDGVAPDAPHVFLALTSANGLAFQRRNVTGGESFHTGVTGGAPVWIRLLIRRNHPYGSATITAYSSNDGVTWTYVGEDGFTFPGALEIGFAVTSHNNAVLNAATFDNIAFNENVIEAPWTAQDIGNVGLAGSTTPYIGRYIKRWQVMGAGDDIFNAADAFHFYHRPMIGNGSISVRVGGLNNTHQWAKAGIMIRESTAPGSRHVYIGFTPTQVTEFLRREVEGGNTIPMAIAPNQHFSIQATRVGNVFTVYYFKDYNWTQMGQVTMNLKTEILMGLAVTSHNTSVLTEANFYDLEYVE